LSLPDNGGVGDVNTTLIGEISKIFDQKLNPSN